MAKYNLENYLAKDGLGFPLNFRRGNPNPLDNSSVWQSLEAAQNYAKTDPVAYVGQILSVVDYTPAVIDDEGTVVTPSQSLVNVYYIKDEAGTLVPVGTSPVGDESTITVDADGTVSLYGIEGLALTREEEDGSTTKISYQPLFVDGKLTWVEPSSTTVEGLSVEIESIKNIIGSEATDSSEATGIYADLAEKASKNDLETLSNTVSSKANQSDLETLSNTVDSKADASNVYSKDDIDSKVEELNTSISDLEDSIDDKIIAEIAKTDHLTRVLSTDGEIADFIANPETAKENTIYMVKKTDGNNIDSYEEYMLFEVAEGEYSFQMIGDSALSLEGYITSDELDTKLEDYATVTTTNSLADLIANNEEAISDLTEVVNQKASADDLANLTNTVADNKKAADDSIAALQESLNSKASTDALNSLTTIVNENKANLEASIKSNTDAIAAINTNLTNNYLTVNDANNTYLTIAAASTGYVKVKEGYDLVKQSEIEKLALIDLDATTGDITLNGKVNVNNVEGLEEHLQSYANVIEAIKISGSSTNLSVVDKTVTLPMATIDSLGLVKGSSEINIAADGSLTAGQINLNNIYQGENDVLYLDGGTSDGSYPSSEY